MSMHDSKITRAMPRYAREPAGAYGLNASAHVCIQVQG